MINLMIYPLRHQTFQFQFEDGFLEVKPKYHIKVKKKKKMYLVFYRLKRCFRSFSLKTLVLCCIEVDPIYHNIDRKILIGIL